MGLPKQAEAKKGSKGQKVSCYKARIARADLRQVEILENAMAHERTINPTRNYSSCLQGMRRARRTRNPAAQQRVEDTSRIGGDATEPALEQEGFVGMWRGREDFEDSSAWVRGLREREWAK